MVLGEKNSSENTKLYQPQDIVDKSFFVSLIFYYNIAGFILNVTVTVFLDKYEIAEQ